MIEKLIKIFLLLVLTFPSAWADETISVCPEGLVNQHIYTIEENKLTYASPDIYLASTGSQYINTGIVPTQNTRVVSKIEVTSNSQFDWIFGVINRNTHGKQSCYGLAINQNKYYSEISGNNKNYGNILARNITHEFDFTVTEIKTPDGTYATGATTLAQTETPMYLFANHAGNGGIYDQRFIGRIYYFKIYEGDELIRHFVPVPNGMQIGDFIVPSDGMWDIVEQKFYENVGTGIFMYGGKTCSPCPAHQYYENESCHDCPPGYTDDTNIGKLSISDCKIHCIGGYIANKYDSKCTNAGIGFWAPRSYISYGQTSTPYKCPENMTTAGFGAVADEADDCGRVMWINNKPIYLRKTKKTKPSINIKLNDSTYYASATPVEQLSNIVDITNLTNQLYLKHDDVTYVVHDDNMYEHHIIENEKINNIGTDTFLSSNGSQYINTGFIPTAQTTIEATIMQTGQNGYNWFFGNIDRATLGKQSCFGLAQYNGNFYSEISGGNKQYILMTKNTKYAIRFTVSGLHLNDSIIPTGASDTTYKPASFPIYLFANNAGNGTTYDQRFIGRIYDFKIYETGELVRHFVPVLKGLIIGDFIIPENGMWDLVEQKFYKNSGTGSFTYGADM